MIKILIQSVAWFVATFVVHYYVLLNISEDLFWQITIGIFVIAIITYIANYEKRMILFSGAAIGLSAFIIYNFVI